MSEKVRLSTIDGIRGITIVSMVLYHFCWDLVYICGMPWQWYGGYGAYLWQQSICWSFILISGFCLNLSGNPAKNGFVVSGCGVLVTLVTLAVMPEEPAICGILTLLGSCMLILSFLRPYLRKIPPAAGFAAGMILFAVTRPVNSGYLGFMNIRLIALPRRLYCGWFSTWLGFPKPGFVSSDYFSLIPWLFLYLAGYFLYGCLMPEKGKGQPDPLFCIRIPVFDRIGRHSLLIYMLHQVVLYGVSMLILYFSR